MMKLLKVLFVSILMLFCILSTASCGTLYRTLVKTDYEFLQDNGEIDAIEIVEIGKLENTDKIAKQEFHIICEIQDTEQFLKDFSAVAFFHRFMDPSQVYEGKIGIKITYRNGDYEIICVGAQATCINGDYDFAKGYHEFDTAQFKGLIDKYSGMSEDVSVSEDASVSEDVSIP